MTYKNGWGTEVVYTLRRTNGMSEKEITLFETYRTSARENIRTVKKHLESEVLLTRRESLDFLFKVYTCGDVKDEKFVKVSKEDKNLIKFYSKFFIKLTDILDEGYTMKSVKKFFDSCAHAAWMSGVSNGRYKVTYSDKNGTIYVTLTKGKKGIFKAPIDDIDDMVSIGAVFVSYLGSELEDENRDREFIADYLLIELKRYEDGKGTMVYIDRRKHDLKDTLCGVRVDRDEASKILSFKVVNL